MIIFFIIACVSALPFLKLDKSESRLDDYLSKERTTALNGLFVLLIFVSHVSTYVDLTSSLDRPYTMIKDFLGQTVVLTFLFYSGFGIARSIQKKGMSYVSGLPYRRFFKVLYHTDIAVLLYLLMNLAIGKNYDLKTNLLAFLSWNSIGNSDWYVFAILGLYIIVFVSFGICKANKYIGTVITTVLSLAFVVFQIKIGRNSWCYNTIMLFPAGMIYSLFKEKIDSIVLKNNITYVITVATAILAFAFAATLRGNGIIFYTVWVMLFMALILLFTMKIQLKNKILLWFGKHVFSIYILQRIPMILFTHIGLNQYKYLFVILCFIVTIGMSALFDFVTEKIDNVIFRKKEELKQ